MAIPREAGRITYSTNIRAMKRIPITDIQRAIVVGSILGDACLSSNWSKTNYRLQIRHSKDQEAYVNWKYENIKEFVLTAPQHYERTRSVWFRTISHPDFSSMYRLFYKDGKKIVPDSIAQLIAEPITMAVWFMDDGNARKENEKVCAYHLNTQSFSFEENQLLQTMLRKVWNVDSSIQLNHGYFRLYIGVKDMSVFREIIRPFILPSLQYKIG